MKKYVITHNQIAGTHFWEKAGGTVAYLKNEHRHIFVIKCEFEVKNSDREIEIIKQENLIRNFIADKYGEPALFGHMSCEMIAEEIVRFFPNCKTCEVLEDGFGGAKIEK